VLKLASSGEGTCYKRLIQISLMTTDGYANFGLERDLHNWQCHLGTGSSFGLRNGKRLASTIVLGFSCRFNGLPKRDV
jgi:hypothetical protein